MSLVSVIIPTYNRAGFVKKCISSVISQTYRPIEIIVVDDGSTDSTCEVLSRIYADLSGQPDLTMNIICLANGGAARAKNTGIRAAKGEWIQFLDSDDLLLPNKIDDALKVATREGVEIVYSKAQFIDEENHRIEKFWGRPLDGSDSDYFEFSWQTMCPVYSRQAIEKIGFWNEALTMQDDWEFCIRGVLSGLAVHFSDRVDSLYRVHSQGNIGSNVSVDKNRDCEETTWLIYDRLTEKQLLTPFLEKRFCSRLLYVILYYYQINEPAAAFRLAKKMIQKKLLSPVLIVALRLLPMEVVSKTVLRLYHA